MADRSVCGWLAAVVALVLFSGVAPAQEPQDAETCAICHDQVAPDFLAGPHGTAMARVDESLARGSCEVCHGAAETHVNEPAADNIVGSPGSEACLSCHRSVAAETAAAVPKHDRRQIECLECHVSGHSPPADEPLLAAAPLDVCGSCHPQQRAAGRLPYAHRDAEGPFACTECHAVHGGGPQGRLTAARTEGACVDCHTGKAGPFVFPHAPVEVDGCVACHQPHGSVNPRLLTRRRALSLCLECHAGVPAFHDITSARYRACRSCHVAIHGSNRDPRLFAK